MGCSVNKKLLFLFKPGSKRSVESSVLMLESVDCCHFVRKVAEDPTLGSKSTPRNSLKRFVFVFGSGMGEHITSAVFYSEQRFCVMSCHLVYLFTTSAFTPNTCVDDFFRVRLCAIE